MANNNYNQISPGTKEKKKYSSSFKFNMVMEGIKNDNLTYAARKYGVNHTLAAKWKSYFLNQGHHIFENSPDKEKIQFQRQIAKLEQLVGKKEVELNLLKNFASFYGSQNSP